LRIASGRKRFPHDSNLLIHRALGLSTERHALIGRADDNRCYAHAFNKRGVAFMLIYRCPNSGKSVRTSIETSGKEIRRLATFKLSVWCPHCQDAHTILGKDASVAPGDLNAAA
jgi:hypothetical protein